MVERSALGPTGRRFEPCPRVFMTKRIVPFVPFTAADPTDLTFSQLKKEIRRGEISKMQRVFLAGRVPALLEQAAGLQHFVLKWVRAVS